MMIKYKKRKGPRPDSKPQPKQPHPLIEGDTLLEWVPVNKMVPVPERPVLLTDGHFCAVGLYVNSPRFISIGVPRPENQWILVGGFGTIRATHWMPLPPLPQPEPPED
jgi:hypothetical protein